MLAIYIDAQEELMTIHNKPMEPKTEQFADRDERIVPVSLGWRKMMVGVALLLGMTMLCLLIVRYVFL